MHFTTRCLSLGLAAAVPLAVIWVCGCTGDSQTETTGRASSGEVGGAGGAGGNGGTDVGGSGGTGGVGGAMNLCVPGEMIACYDGPATTIGVGTCKEGTKTCFADGSGYGDCENAVLPQQETCNGVDDDCNGKIDNGVLVTYYPDGDSDGYGDSMAPVEACSAPSGFVANGTDCDDANPDVNPGASEIPNGDDDDCDGQLNEGVYFESCKAILESLPGSPNGSYNIDPDGPLGAGQPFEVSCEMTANGGGWTLITRTNGGLAGTIHPWVDILSQNFFFAAGDFTLSQNVPAGYLVDKDFFAILHAAADLQFSEVRLDDNKGISLQNIPSPKTLRMIHGATGVESLYKNAANTGVLLLLGNANHTAMMPCYYPNPDGLSCQTYFTGDSGNETTAFYVGDLSFCAGGPAAGDLTAALWGSGDCYSADAYGGFGGFTFRRPFHVNQGKGSYANGGFAAGGWSIHVR